MLTLIFKDKSPKVPAYLKVVDKYSADFTYCRFGAQSNGFSSSATGSKKPNPKTSVSFEAFYVN